MAVAAWITERGHVIKMLWLVVVCFGILLPWMQYEDKTDNPVMAGPYYATCGILFGSYLLFSLAVVIDALDRKATEELENLFRFTPFAAIFALIWSFLGKHTLPVAVVSLVLLTALALVRWTIVHSWPREIPPKVPQEEVLEEMRCH